jgi:molybdopterin molybdotransferase
MNNCDKPGLMPLEIAVERILSQCMSVPDCQNLDLLNAHGRVLASDIRSPINVPPADNSAMDGYAFNSKDLQITDRLEQVGTSMAGTPYIGNLTSGQCVRIMTGAIIPKGADAVLMQEQTEKHHGKIRFLKKPESGNSIRRAGEDIAIGSCVLKQGQTLRAADLALLASIGVSRIDVTRKIKVALIATGDELTIPGKPLAEGAIYESNRIALQTMLSAMQCEVIDFGIVDDNLDTLTTVIKTASSQCDLVISCGGVSVGEADFVKDVLAQIGQVDFWKVAIKPGKPFAFGKIQQALFCGLPGNPVSSYVTFQQLVVPLINKLSGKLTSSQIILTAKTVADIRKRAGRADFQRAVFYNDEQGKLVVEPNKKQGSGVMSSIAYSNCYILLEKDQSDIKQGTNVRILPFDFIQN